MIHFIRSFFYSIFFGEIQASNIIYSWLLYLSFSLNFKFQRKKIFFQDFVFEFQIIQVEFPEIAQIYLDSMVLKYIILYLEKKI